MGLFDKMLGKKKTVEEFENGMSSCLNKKGVSLRISNHPDKEWHYYFQKGEDDSTYDAATTYELGLTYSGHEKEVYCYVILYSSGTHIEGKFEDMALKGLKNYMSGCRHFFIDSYETRKRRIDLSMMEHEGGGIRPISSVDIPELCKQLYDTIKLYSELKGSHGHTIKDFAEMEKNFSDEHNKQKDILERDIGMVEKKRDELARQMEELEMAINERKNEMKTKLQDMCVEFNGKVEKEAMKVIDAAKTKMAVEA